jgi:hypothetical protein
VILGFYFAILGSYCRDAQIAEDGLDFEGEERSTAEGAQWIQLRIFCHAVFELAPGSTPADVREINLGQLHAAIGSNR